MEFGALFGAIFLAIAAYVDYKHHNTALSSGLSLVGIGIALLGYRAPNILLPFWAGWMKLGHAIGSVVNLAIMMISWFVIAVPIGLILKVIGKSVMDLSYRAPVETYWEDRPDRLHDFSLLERQF